ncbi:MAG: hypothetical protein WBA97_28035 [Actinophytocola sp.]|uniref:hypothetical protein n=1 Tax=Actinophytocola sp. TaxID=1872138 RepID=UPI003C77FD51
MWQSRGDIPEAGGVIGQSRGEITAAVVAGALSMPDGLVFNHRRAELTAPGRGRRASPRAARADARSPRPIE